MKNTQYTFKKALLLALLTTLQSGIFIHSNPPSKELNNALIQAAQAGKLDTINSLASQGANIHTENELPALCAIDNGHMLVARRLLDLGADQTVIKKTLRDKLSFMAYTNLCYMLGLSPHRGAQPTDTIEKSDLEANDTF
ncbi:hypothetical protein CVU75_01080 [Candidatus Dependentiae bacterium HGW-Dependentiae-1]|nr:MAG: hypothetical protein CVU75_01080 [Candidatus Dependentiae bacterium HGW-Dependentiae-1]